MTEREFVEKWANKISAELTEFPRGYGEISESTKIAFDEKTLKLGSEFFGDIEIVNSRGEQVFLAKNYTEAKFILYAFRFSNEITLPTDDKEIENCVKNYESSLDDFVREIKNDFEIHFEDKTALLEITNKIFKKLNLQRH